MNTVQHNCVVNSRRPHVLNGAACVSQRGKKRKEAGHWCCTLWPRGRCQTTWVDGFMRRMFPAEKSAFVFGVLHSGHMLMYMYRTAGTESGNFTFQVTSSLAFHHVCFRKAQICCCILPLWMASFYLTDQAGDVWMGHGMSYASTSICLQLQRHVPQLITNGSMCMPFMHEGAWML